MLEFQFHYSFKHYLYMSSSHLHNHNSNVLTVLTVYELDSATSPVKKRSVCMDMMNMARLEFLLWLKCPSEPEDL